VYRRDPALVVQFVAGSAGNDSLRDLADAFRIKRDVDR